MTTRTRRAYDAWTSSYDSDRNPHIAMEFGKVMEILVPRKGEKILDAGCGTGRYTSERCAIGVRVTGIDFSKKMLALAADKCPEASLVFGDLARKLPFRDKSFDKVNCAQVLNHFRKLLHPMKEFARVLKPLGVLVFSVIHPDMNWDGYVRKDDSQNRFRLSENSDLFRHRFCDYFDAIERAGFLLDRIVQIQVSKAVRHYLTSESYNAVKGRYQIAIFRAQVSPGPTAVLPRRPPAEPSI